MTDAQAEELLVLLRGVHDGIWNIREVMAVRLTDGEKNELARRLRLRQQKRNPDDPQT